MAPFKLKNNTGVRSERNLCFVNSALQLLNSIPEFRDLFKSKTYRLNCIKNEKLPFSDELSRLFNFSGNSSTSAAALRSLIATSSKKPYLCDGSQRDIAEFIEIMLEELEKELSEISFDAAHLLQRFYGTQIEEKHFFRQLKDAA